MPKRKKGHPASSFKRFCSIVARGCGFVLGRRQIELLASFFHIGAPTPWGQVAYEHRVKGGANRYNFVEWIFFEFSSDLFRDPFQLTQFPRVEFLINIETGQIEMIWCDRAAGRNTAVCGYVYRSTQGRIWKVRLYEELVRDRDTCSHAAERGIPHEEEEIGGQFGPYFSHVIMGLPFNHCEHCEHREHICSLCQEYIYTAISTYDTGVVEADLFSNETLRPRQSILVCQSCILRYDLRCRSVRGTLGHERRKRTPDRDASHNLAKLLDLRIEYGVRGAETSPQEGSDQESED